jgi:hypothetical protein
MGRWDGGGRQHAWIERNRVPRLGPFSDRVAGHRSPNGGVGAIHGRRVAVPPTPATSLRGTRSRAPFAFEFGGGRRGAERERFSTRHLSDRRGLVRSRIPRKSERSSRNWPSRARSFSVSGKNWEHDPPQGVELSVFIGGGGVGWVAGARRMGGRHGGRGRGGRRGRPAPLHRPPRPCRPTKPSDLRHAIRRFRRVDRTGANLAAPAAH